MTAAKKCTKKCDASAELLFCSQNLFFAFSQVAAVGFFDSVIFHSENLMTINNLHTASLCLVSQDWHFSRARGSLMRGFPVRPYLTVLE